MITMDSRQFRRGLQRASDVSAWVVVAVVFVVVSVWFGLAWCGYVPGCVIGG